LAKQDEQLFGQGVQVPVTLIVLTGHVFRHYSREVEFCDTAGVKLSKAGEHWKHSVGEH
jgi:hypothetical protein